MPEHQEHSTSGKKELGFFTKLLLLVLILAFGGDMYFRWDSKIHRDVVSIINEEAVEAVDDHYLAKTKNLPARIGRGDQKALVENATRQLKYRDTINKIRDPMLAFPKNCPTDEQHKEATGEVWYDFSACVNDEVNVTLPWALRHKATEYQAGFFSGNLPVASRSEVSEVTEKPTFRANSPGSIATPNPDGSWTLANDIVVRKPKGKVATILWVWRQP